MKFLDAKRSRSPIANKMAAGPSADKSASPAENIPPAKVGIPLDKEPNATPAAARIAAELGIDLASIQGSGAEGLVLVSDVRSAAEAARATTSQE